MLKRNIPDLTKLERGDMACSIFNGLTDEEKRCFLSKGRAKIYQRGEYLFIQGDSVKSFYLLQEGVVRLFRTTPNGEEITTDILTDGDTICERKVIKFDSVHPDYALAVENSVVLEFPSAWLRETVRKIPALSINMLSIISQRALIKDIESEHRVTMSAAQVVACFLQRLCVTHGFDPAGFDLPYNKSLIASRLGMKQETFSRALPKLKENGIDLQGTRVNFYNFNDLDQYTCAQCSFMDDCPARQRLEKIDGQVPAKKTLAA